MSLVKGARPEIHTNLGALYGLDCIDFLSHVESNTVDLCFADPPFNVGKQYPSGINDHKADYMAWCRLWLDGLILVTKPGGSIFLYNLPKWNLQIASYLADKLTLRHWVVVDMRSSPPIRHKLQPSHYSLLYYTKGPAPTIFHPDRIPIKTCRHCDVEIPDHGGHRHKANPKGLSLSDVWSDIHPVRARKYKNRSANALPLKLMDRIVAMASDEGSLVLDPFGGSGTTYVAAELSGRRWIGSELDCEAIRHRFSDLTIDRGLYAQIQAGKNILRLPARKSARKRRPQST